MKNLAFMFILCLSVNSVCAANIFENNNPFPQTTPQTMNNLYEAEPATIQKEVKQEKKSWFKKGKNLQEQEIKDAEKRLYTYPPEANKHEGVQDGSFFMFQ